jgi:hypothetical protein
MDTGEQQRRWAPLLWTGYARRLGGLGDIAVVLA